MANGWGEKRTYITISSSEDDDDTEEDEEDDDPSECESEEEFEENEEDDGVEETSASTSSCNDSDDDDQGGSQWSDDEADESDDEKSADHDRNELLSNSVVSCLREKTDLEELNLEECKSYLRLHRLRITGTKAECIQRIKEHWRIKNGNAEALYPRSSFSINCTGDVCKGDVVLFRQRVNKKFDKVTRNGSFLGTRTIAGRVVKESYGAARQQHTFTIEVLWSKSFKKLPPLFPLLVKGRNLYRLKTFRQRWHNETQRVRVLAEKHKRGAAARSVRAMKKRKQACSTNRSAKRQKRSYGGPSHTTTNVDTKAVKHGNNRGKAPAEHAKSNKPRQKVPPIGRANPATKPDSRASRYFGNDQNPTHHSRYVDPAATWSSTSSQYYLQQPQMQFHRERPSVLPLSYSEAGFSSPTARLLPLSPYERPHFVHQGAIHRHCPRPSHIHRPSYVYDELRSFNQSREPNMYGLSRPLFFQGTYGQHNNR